MEQKVINLSDVVGGGYNDYWTTTKRYVVCKGSRGSKKSKTTALWLISHIIANPQANALCVRKFASTLRDSCFSDLQWAMDRLGVLYHFKCTTNPLEITYLPTGQKILFRGLDDGLKVTSISVPKGVLCWVWIEECYELNRESDFDKLDMSIRGEVPQGINKRIMLTFNPWSANSWLKARFFDTPSDNVFTKTTTWKCNEWLDDSDKSIFIEMQKNNPRRYRIEGDGDWGIADGLIYENVVQQDFNLDDVRTIPNSVACFGLDFGFTDPNAFVACIVDRDNKKIYVFDEWYKSHITNEVIAQMLIDKGYSNQKIICDCAEPKSIAELQDKGIYRAEPSRKGADSVNHGIQLLQNYQFVVSPKCKEFYIEISNYCWSKDKNGQCTDKPDHEYSHGMDAIRYATAKVLVGDRYSW